MNERLDEKHREELHASGIGPQMMRVDSFSRVVSSFGKWLAAGERRLTEGGART